MSCYLDIGKSFSKGKWFMKTIFTNLCVEMVTYVKKCDEKVTKTRVEGNTEGDARKILLAAYTSMFCLPKFIETAIAKRHFHELQARSRNQMKVSKAPDASVHQRMIFDEPPPSEDEG